MAWRCDLCGRLHLRLEPSPRPEACVDCGGDEFSAAGPGDDSGGFLPLNPPERRRFPRRKLR